jgi:hypothetical protein
MPDPGDPQSKHPNLDLLVKNLPITRRNCDDVRDMLTGVKRDRIPGVIVGWVNAEIATILAKLAPEARAVLAENQRLRAQADDDTRTVRRTAQAIEKMIGDWGVASETVRQELWRHLGDAGDILFDRFRERFTELDRQAAEGDGP